MWNKYQTQYEDLNLDQQPEEVKEQFLEAVNNIPFVKSLISADRPRAKDLKKDSEGKIIIDVTQPHILEDMDYFRPSAIFFQQNGCYTKLRPNPNPNSEYYKWAKEEIRRCFEGYVRPSDGEWITGDMYFFLNYCPIQLIKKDKSGKNIRTIDFPRPWDGHYYKFHYLNQCRQNGKHAAELSRRGSGKSYTSASLLAKRFILGESYDVVKKVQCVVTASEKKYLQGANQVLDMFQYYIDFCASNTQFPNKTITSSLPNMQWIMGYKDKETGVRKGSENSVVGVTSKDDESKLRGSRGVLYLIEEAGCHLKGTEVIMYDGTTKCVEDVKVGDKLMGDDGTPREVLRLYNGVDTMYKITLSNGDYQIVNSTHPVYYRKYNWNKKEYINCLNTAPELLYKDVSKGCYIHKASVLDNVSYEHKKLPIDPYWLGLWLGDGDKTRMSVANEDPEVIEWLEEYCKTNNLKYTKRFLPQSKNCYSINISKENDIYKEFKKLGLENNKHIPQEYILTSYNNIVKLVAGLIDTDGTYDKKKHCYEITQVYTRKHILDNIKRMCESIGLKCSMSSRIAGSTAKGAGHLNYRLRITGVLEGLPIQIARKKWTPRSGFKNKKCWQDYSFKVEHWGIGEFYGFTVDQNNLFLLKDYTVVHNTFPRLLNLYQVLRPSVEDGNSVWGLIFLYGTSGDNESDFSSMQELMYNPRGYNINALPNVYDKEGQGRREFTFFFPGYLNRADCYDKDGNSDVTKALLQIYNDRYTVKYNSTNINAITKRIAEIPITPQEAILRTRGNMFPVTQLNERLNELDNNPSEFDDVYVGDLAMSKTGKISWVATNDKPLREFPLKDNKANGAIEIFKMPEKDKEGNVFNHRYIAGVDPIDDDASGTVSLVSCIILDLWTDKIVCEWTGRLDYADDCYERIRLMLLFYNARCLYENNKKGMFAYFSRMNCLYLLADCPDYLRDKDMVKGQLYGNKLKGVNATLGINNYANEQIKNWLIKPVVTTIKEGDEEEQIQVFNLFFIRNRALLKELILFNPDINVDRIRALGMCMLLREERVIMYQGDIKGKAQAKPNTLASDPFFMQDVQKPKEDLLDYHPHIAEIDFSNINVFKQ